MQGGHILSTLVVHAKLNIKEKQQTDLKTTYSVKIGGAAVPQCLHTIRAVTATIPIEFCVTS